MRSHENPFDVITVDYVIEECTDLGALRALARQYRSALLDTHEKATHLLDIDDCPDCLRARDEGEPSYACDQYKAWQKAFEDALAADQHLPALDSRPKETPGGADRG